jgi:hypothetical protein
MKETYYLPGEVLSNGNYPEVNGVIDDINDILDFVMNSVRKLDLYLNGSSDKIDVDIVSLPGYIDKCRNVCETLGNASNVCFDLLIDLRKVQECLQTLTYIKNRYGSQYIGTSTAV